MATSARKQREIEQREALILDVARKMLLEVGYIGLNMDRIAEATEYSKGTIYQHFSCKEDVLVALCHQSLQKQAEFFERAATFKGRTRERMAAIGEAYALFVRLHPHYFQSGQIIHSAAVRAKTSDERQRHLQTGEHRCMAVVSGIIRDAIAQGDLVPPVWSSPEKLTFGLWAMTFGAYMLMTSDLPLEILGIGDPRATLRGNSHALLDGFGWHPLSSEWDYEQTYARIRKEVFPDEYRQAQVG